MAGAAIYCLSVQDHELMVTLQGAGSAIGNTAIQIYSVEIAPPHLRARLGYTFQVGGHCERVKGREKGASVLVCMQGGMCACTKYLKAELCTSADIWTDCCATPVEVFGTHLCTCMCAQIAGSVHTSQAEACLAGLSRAAVLPASLMLVPVLGSWPLPICTVYCSHAGFDQGQLISPCMQAGISLGVVSAQAVNAGTQHIYPWGWRLSIGLAAVPALVFLVGVCVLPDTPSSLLSRGFHDEVQTREL